MKEAIYEFLEWIDALDELAFWALLACFIAGYTLGVITGGAWSRRRYCKDEPKVISRRAIEDICKRSRRKDVRPV